MTTRTLPDALRPYFWDTDFDKLDMLAHRRFIAERLWRRRPQIPFASCLRASVGPSCSRSPRKAGGSMPGTASSGGSTLLRLEVLTPEMERLAPVLCASLSRMPFTLAGGTALALQAGTAYR
ncbi:MAG: DUF6922 domain-containing protein [Gammaproteobacteria bacterium]